MLSHLHQVTLNVAPSSIYTFEQAQQSTHMVAFGYWYCENRNSRALFYAWSFFFSWDRNFSDDQEYSSAFLREFIRNT